MPTPDDLFKRKASLQDMANARGSVRTPPVVDEPPPADEPPPLPPDAAPQEIHAPVVTNAPSSDRKFPCKQCGARLDFDPGQRALACPYCGHVEKIDPANIRVEERDYMTALGKLNCPEGVIEGRSSEVRCPGCGAMVLLEDNVATDKCPFCATHLASAPAQRSQTQIIPEYVLPFAVSQRNAVAEFNDWIRSRWFAPNDLKRLANLGQLSGVYLPFWTYDSMTYTHYTGMRGDDYYVTESYTTVENGRTVRRTRQVRKTRWTYVSGEVDHFFDDVLICASRSLPRNYVDALEPWDLHKLTGFQPHYLAGFKTERYVIGLPEGFGLATQVMDGHIRTLCKRDIGGDHQRLHSVNTQHVGVTYKHLLLPLWLAVYRYKDQTHRILVNARTGEVQGTRPWSWIKITLAVLAALIVIGIIVAIVAATQGR